MAPAESGTPPPESDGVGGAGSTRAPVGELPGVVTPDPPDEAVGDAPADTEVEQRPAPDGGLPPSRVDADAGAPGAGTPDPPPTDTVQIPPCMGLALTLDGTSYASIPRPVDNDFTLEAWIQTTVSPAGMGAFNGSYLFDADIVGMGPRDDFALALLNDRLAFGVGNPDTTVQGARAVTTGEWEHVAVTRRASNGQVQVIINGELDAVALTSNNNPLSARPELAIGGFPDMRRFIGSVDEVKLWSVVRTVQQIAAGMRERPTGSEEGLVGYYPFEDQGSIQTADASSSGSSATLTGSPGYEPSTALCPPAQPPGSSD